MVTTKVMVAIGAVALAAVLLARYRRTRNGRAAAIAAAECRLAAAQAGFGVTTNINDIARAVANLAAAQERALPAPAGHTPKRLPPELLPPEFVGPTPPQIPPQIPEPLVRSPRPAPSDTWWTSENRG